MENSIVGILIVITNILVIVGGLLYKHFEWKKNAPKIYVGNMGVKYTQGSTEWEGMDKVVSILNSKLSSKYGEKFATELLNRTWIEVVGPQGARMTPTTTVSEANRIAGSIDSTRKFPWSTKYWIAVVLQRPEYKTANDGAIFHEIDKHIVCFERGQGLNNDHKNPEFAALEEDMHFAYRQWKA